MTSIPPTSNSCTEKESNSLSHLGLSDSFLASIKAILKAKLRIPNSKHSHMRTETRMSDDRGTSTSLSPMTVETTSIPSETKLNNDIPHSKSMESEMVLEMRKETEFPTSTHGSASTDSLGTPIATALSWFGGQNENYTTMSSYTSNYVGIDALRAQELQSLSHSPTSSNLEGERTMAYYLPSGYDPSSAYHGSKYDSSLPMEEIYYPPNSPRSRSVRDSYQRSDEAKGSREVYESRDRKRARSPSSDERELRRKKRFRGSDEHELHLDKEKKREKEHMRSNDDDELEKIPVTIPKLSGRVRHGSLYEDIVKSRELPNVVQVLCIPRVLSDDEIVALLKQAEFESEADALKMLKYEAIWDDGGDYLFKNIVPAFRRSLRYLSPLTERERRIVPVYE